MKTFFAEEQRRHDPKSFLSSGAPKPNPEVPERVERLLVRREGRRLYGRASARATASARSPPSIRRNISSSCSTSIERWQRIEGASAEVIPNIHPIARGGSRPDSAVGQAGYHMADTACPISAETYDSSCWSAWTAVAAAEAVAAGAPVRLCALPAAGASRLRRCRRRLLLLQQFGDRRAAPARYSRRVSPSSTSTCITATARRACFTAARTF